MITFCKLQPSSLDGHVGNSEYIVRTSSFTVQENRLHAIHSVWLCHSVRQHPAQQCSLCKIRRDSNSSWKVGQSEVSVMCRWLTLPCCCTITRLNELDLRFCFFPPAEVWKLSRAPLTHGLLNHSASESLCWWRNGRCQGRLLDTTAVYYALIVPICCGVKHFKTHVPRDFSLMIKFENHFRNVLKVVAPLCQTVCSDIDDSVKNKRVFVLCCIWQILTITAWEHWGSSLIDDD